MQLNAVVGEELFWLTSWNRKELYILYVMLLTDLWCMTLNLFGFIIVASKPAIEDAAWPACEIASPENKPLDHPVWPTDEHCGEKITPHLVQKRNLIMSEFSVSREIKQATFQVNVKEL